MQRRASWDLIVMVTCLHRSMALFISIQSILDYLTALVPQLSGLNMSQSYLNGCSGILDSGTVISEVMMTSCHGQTFSALLAICEVNPSMTNGFHSQMASKAVIWCYCCWHERAIAETIELPVIWDAMTHMWRQCNGDVLWKTKTLLMPFVLMLNATIN